mmetsp:Transcript_90594/g.161358  ORF Transcript_90594/g.161358 Transcript_90594/m.161358 type:complete len:194 (-) Transcript_90594:36-617(-)
MKQWISQVAQNRGSKGGSAKCPVGLFKSKVKDSVVPLCEEHFPDDKAKNEWVVLFYNQKENADMKDFGNRLANDFGNDPPDMSKALKKPKKKRERLESLAEKYDVKVNLPSKGPFGMDALAKVGGVCCDCGEEAAAFCSTSLRQGEEDLKTPQAFWVAKGQRTLLKDVEFTAPQLFGRTVEKLGFSAQAKSEL